MGTYKFILPIALSALAFAQPMPAQAADISLNKSKDGRTNSIVVQGQIEGGDYAKFKALLSGSKAQIVILASPGGRVSEALAIGAVIRVRNMATAAGKDCTSACGFIWLAGKPRFISSGARVGFHAVHKLGDDGKAHVTSDGNALLGSYLRDLGLSLDAIQYITATSPSDMQWLSLADAKKFGIRLTLLPPCTDCAPKPSLQKPTREQALEMAAYASQLVAAKTFCSKLHHIDIARIDKSHRELMSVGPKGADDFFEILAAKVAETAQDFQLHGASRFCSSQRLLFLDANITDIYLDSRPDALEATSVNQASPTASGVAARDEAPSSTSRIGTDGLTPVDSIKSRWLGPYENADRRKSLR
jgi:hypothetical protein